MLHRGFDQQFDHSAYFFAFGDEIFGKAGFEPVVGKNT